MVRIRWLLLCMLGSCIPSARGGDDDESWELLRNNSGVVAMHMALTHRNTVIIFDQTGVSLSAIRLPRRWNGRRCTMSPQDINAASCFAHSVEYDIVSNSIRPLLVQTDPWCSSGAFLSNGTLLQTGGHDKGYRKVRYFVPCSDKRCDWVESTSQLSGDRWYASNQILPENDNVIVVGGRKTFTYEFVPKLSAQEGAFELPLLRQTYDSGVENNLYPFLHLSSDGNLFIFANRDSILFNYRTGAVVRNFPSLEGSRNYPSTGSSVMLPLDYSDGFKKVEILICGGSSPGALSEARKGRFLKGLSTCGRMDITDRDPKWEIEEMPSPRLMNDMIILPTGDILIINGAQQGTAGWFNAINPELKPLLYKPGKEHGHRFSYLPATDIPRMYHSTAILLPDGRILVAGSNPNEIYDYNNKTYPTEMRIQVFIPYYMNGFYDGQRPRNIKVGYNAQGAIAIVRYGERFSVHFILAYRREQMGFRIYAPPFTTHSISMNQRMLSLECVELVTHVNDEMSAVLVAPHSPVSAPSGYYLLFIVNGDIPSQGQWVRFIN